EEDADLAKAIQLSLKASTNVTASSPPSASNLYPTANLSSQVECLITFYNCLMVKPKHMEELDEFIVNRSARKLAALFMNIIERLEFNWLSNSAFGLFFRNVFKI